MTQFLENTSFSLHLEHPAQGPKPRSTEKRLVVVDQLKPGLLRLHMPLALQAARVCVGVKMHTDLLWSPTTQQKRKYPFLKSYKPNLMELQECPTPVPSSSSPLWLSPPHPQNWLSGCSPGLTVLLSHSFVTRKHRQVCADPQKKWVRDHINSLEMS